MQQTLEAPTVEALHDRFMALGKAFASNPSLDTARPVEDAYRAFYVAYVGHDRGLEMAVEDLLGKMARTMGQYAR